MQSAGIESVYLKAFELDRTLPQLRTSVQLISSRQRFGIYRQVIVRMNSWDKILSQNEHRSQEYIYLWACQILGIGVRWSRQRLYGTVLPSVSVHPVVATFSPPILWLLYFDDLSNLEQVFHKGDLHPYTRDESGMTLFHVSIDQPDQHTH